VRLLALGAAVFLLSLAAAAQLLLPGFAERDLRGDLADAGEVRRVDVDAFPALKVLFGRADRVEVEMGEVKAGQGELADLLARTADTAELRAVAETLRVGPFVAHAARLDKDGDRLRGRVSVTVAELTAALPLEVGLEPVETEDGSLLLEATAGVLGQQVTVRARLAAREGAVVIAPEGLLGGFATLTVFEDPRVRVRRVGAEPATGGFTVTADAIVRG
jgi:hypothetical protein